MAIAKRLTGLVSAAICLTGCSGGKSPFRQVQFCLAGPQEIPEFKTFMNEIAQENRMEFGDRSGQTQDELQALHADNKEVPINDQIVNISGYRDDFSFGAGNTGLPTQQISIGFSGNDIQSAKKFADTVVKKLSARWRIHEVPQGQGTFPLSRCDYLPE